MKQCKLCKEVKSLSEFYSASGYKDGYSTRCKKCVAEKAKESEANKPIEEVRQRHREKYHRLNYKEKQREWDKDKNWKNSNVYKGLFKKLKIPKNFECHHWNYNDEFLEDVIIMDKNTHRQFHNYLILNKKLKIFETKDGEILDTKDKHLEYFYKLGFTINQ